MKRIDLKLFLDAFKCSVPVLLGYLAIGAAFGLMMADAGYSWGLTLLMSVVMYAGAGQYIAVGLLASGASLAEAVFVQLVVNARHIAYGITMFKRFNAAGAYKPYLIFALTDETFALLSSRAQTDTPDGKNGLFMLYVSALNHLYWIAGGLAGVFAGAWLPFSFEGVSFALTALFIVLMIEQVMRVKRALPFVIPALAAILAVALLPARASLLSALTAALAACRIFSPSKPLEGADAV